MWSDVYRTDITKKHGKDKLGEVIAKALLLSLGACVMFVKVICFFSCAMHFTVKQEHTELRFESHSSWKYHG